MMLKVALYPFFFLPWFTGMEDRDNCEKSAKVDNSDRTGSNQRVDCINDESEFVIRDRSSISPMLKAQPRSSISPEADMFPGDFSIEDINQC